VCVARVETVPCDDVFFLFLFLCSAKGGGAGPPSSTYPFAILGYMSTCLHVLCKHKMGRFGVIICAHRTCNHVSFVVIFYVYMHRCTKETCLTRIFEKKRSIQKNLSTVTHMIKKISNVYTFTCVHAQRHHSLTSF
jgi:hypothetical protein